MEPFGVNEKNWSEDEKERVSKSLTNSSFLLINFPKSFSFSLYNRSQNS